MTKEEMLNKMVELETEQYELECYLKMHNNFNACSAYTINLVLASGTLTLFNSFFINNDRMVNSVLFGTLTAASIGIGAIKYNKLKKNETDEDRKIYDQKSQRIEEVRNELCKLDNVYNSLENKSFVKKK